MRTAAVVCGLACFAPAALLAAARYPTGAPVAAFRRVRPRIVVLSDPGGPAAPREPVDLRAFVLGEPGAPVSWSVSAARPGVATIRRRTADSAVFLATRPGVYAVAAAGGAAVRHLRLRVYGAPAAVRLSPFRPRLVADGRATDTLRVTVVDRHGTRVAGFVGDVELEDAFGQFCRAGGNPGRTRVRLEGGSGTAALCAPSLPVRRTDDVESADLQRAGYPVATAVAGVRYGTASVRDVPATSTGIALTALWGGERRLVARGALGMIAIGPTDLSANRTQGVTLELAVDDAAGNPVPGAHAVRLRLAGPASLSATSAVKTEVLRYPDASTFTVYSEPGRPGAIRVTAASSGLRSAAYAVRTVVNSAPAHLRVLISRGFDNRHMPYDLYDVQVVDGRGQAMPDVTGAIEVRDAAGTLRTRNPVALGQGRSAASILYAPGALAADAGAYRPGPPAAAIAFPIVDGSAAFAVETGAAGTLPARLRISDPALGFSLTPRYVWAVGPPAMAVITGGAGAASPPPCGGRGCPLAVTVDRPAAVAAQVTDARGNPVARAGLPVLFSLRPASASTAVHARFVTGSGAGVWALTNAHGVASVKVVASAEGAPAFFVAASFDQHVVVQGVRAVDAVGAGGPPA